MSTFQHTYRDSSFQKADSETVQIRCYVVQRRPRHYPEKGERGVVFRHWDGQLANGFVSIQSLQALILQPGVGWYVGLSLCAESVTEELSCARTAVQSRPHATKAEGEVMAHMERPHPPSFRTDQGTDVNSQIYDAMYGRRNRRRESIRQATQHLETKCGRVQVGREDLFGHQQFARECICLRLFGPSSMAGKQVGEPATLNLVLICVQQEMTDLVGNTETTLAFRLDR